MTARPHLDQDGAGEPVLFVHASGLSGRQWGGPWRTLGPYRRLLPDLWGCGRSPPWPGPWPFRLAYDLDVLREHLVAHGPVHLVGHSYGGTLALMLAAELPHLVRSVAVYEAPLLGVLQLPPEERIGPRIDAELAGTEAWYEQFVDWWNGPGAWRSLPEPSRKAQLRAGREVYGQVSDLLADRHDVRWWSAVKAPILLIHGTLSPPIVHRALRAFAEGHPTAALRVLPGQGHLAPVMAAEVVAPLVRDHLARVAR